ncbi:MULTISPECIES: hypothetical protein [unclassified Arthrobacter]|uniref:hypothetical protein n=1 Tax=unclassified Arthrobacter TaxID=235627 RepID=UPI001E556B24|nr:hypothetical protein [Arthrobacter sp. Bi26]
MDLAYIARAGVPAKAAAALPCGQFQPVLVHGILELRDRARADTRHPRKPALAKLHEVFEGFDPRVCKRLARGRRQSCGEWSAAWSRGFSRHCVAFQSVAPKLM